jgi:hypothetical protein
MAASLRSMRASTTRISSRDALHVQIQSDSSLD